MQIIIAEHSGFCMGVESAINLAKKAVASSSNVFCLGDIIHNRGVVSNLESQGIMTVHSITDIPSFSNVIIRAHGVEKKIEQALQANNCSIIDATCPFVKKIHNIVSSYSANGYYIIVLGDALHQEVKSTVSYAKEFSVVSDTDRFLSEFSIESHDKYLVVTQTTINEDYFREFEEKFRKKASNMSKVVEFINTICYTTIIRQLEALAIAKKSDTVLVLGDPHSSNCKNLANIASKHCPNTYLISDVSELNLVTNTNIAILGILAGASTPKELIMEVFLTMTDNTTNIIEEDVTTAEAVTTQNDVAEAVTAQSAVAEAVTAQDDVAEANIAAEAKIAEEPKKANKEITTMEQALKHYGGRKIIKEGSKVKATIVSINDTGVLVSVSGLAKNDSGYIEKEEMELDGSYEKSNYSVGQEVEAVVIPKNPTDKTKGLSLSKKKFDAIKIDDEAVKQILLGAEFHLVCPQEIKGGLLGKLGSYTIFVPASQIRIGFVKNLADYTSKALRLRILPPKEDENGETKATRNPKRIVASQRIILEEEKSSKEEAFWSIMEVNNIVTGKVKRFSPFGAFVSIMGHDCLAHISDLSWSPIKDPAEILELNKNYDFVVLKVDRENDKVSIGYKQLQKKPYEIAAEKYPVGTIIKGKVERIQSYGAFVEIEKGIDGLVHVSQIAHNFTQDIFTVLSIGQEVEAKIIGFEDNKITLSIKALLANDQKADVEEEGKVSETSEKQDRRKPRKDREDVDHREFISNAGGATFADIFGNLDFEFDKE